MKILIVDDSVFLRNMMTKVLKQNIKDVEVLQCCNGKSAYETFLSDTPNLLITDLLMPEMTGQELLQALKNNRISVKTIVISADIQKATRDELQEMGIVEFINKPLTSEKMTGLIELVKELANA